MNRNILQQTTPDLDDGRRNDRRKGIYITLAVFFIALVAVCGWLALELHAARSDIATLEQALQDEQVHCSALQTSGQTAINRAVEIMEDIDEERAEVAGENGNYRFGLGSVAGAYRMFLETTWEYTLSQVEDSGA